MGFQKTSTIVSIIIPCYNGDKTLRETIESVLAQTYKAREIIVIDDGSTDSSAQLIRSFGSQIKAEFNPNRGASAARNRGTELAQGEFIQYLDADDLLAPDALERRVAALQASGADVAYADWQRLEQQADGTYQPGAKVERDMATIHPDPEIACATSFWAPPVALLYRRRIVDAIGGWNETLPVIQDARFLFDAARLGARFVRVPGIGGYYRVNGDDSLSRRDNRAFVLDVYRNACQIQALWDENGGLTAPRRQALGGIYDYVARSLFQWGLPEFDDAVTRLRAVQPRGPGHYPELAHLLSRLVGSNGASAMMNGVVRLRRHLQRMV